ncbi:MAG: anhydro-N-acetylmuramic acid kinase [Pseudomonadota bacterium]
MSGTSMDGIDLAVVRTDGVGEVFRQLPATMKPYPQDLRNAIADALEEAKAIRDRSDRPDSLRDVELAITKCHFELVREFLAEHNEALPKVDVIGFHGQTVLHRPQEAITVQLGDGARLAAATGIPVISDMRANDMAHGGQGAPLAPAYHSAIATASKDVLASGPVVFVNLGGISNITYVKGDDLIAFDTGPSNALIDQWMQLHFDAGYDAGGKQAQKGSIQREIINPYFELSFFSKPLPKSLDRLDFELPLAHRFDPVDVLRSLTRLTSEAVMKAQAHLPEKPKAWILCGGGRHNQCIVADMRELAGENGARVLVAEDIGLRGDLIEAEAWAYLAVRSLKGLPLTFPGTTGCSKPVSGGILHNP